jgi:hypothetical protein
MALGDDKAFTAAGDAVDAYDKATCGVVPVGAAPSTTAG